MIRIRPALAADQRTINRIVRDMHINPMNLDWRRFVVAEDNGPSTSLRMIVGVGQVKPHSDGSRELASIAVISQRQGQGIGSAIIRTLLAKETGELYLMCRDVLEQYYARLGFRRVARDEMTPYFKKMLRAANIFSSLAHTGVKIIVMKRN